MYNSQLIIFLRRKENSLAGYILKYLKIKVLQKLN